MTDPITKRISEKTLEAWVKLDTLDQRGGGVMTLQTKDGRFFDSIVFGEMESREWMSGSNHFARTESFGGQKEDRATRAPVHLAIAYHADGSITGYRDGMPYGQAYMSDGPHRFEPDESVVSFGVRHLPASGNRLLSGSVFKARLYNVALTADQVAASARGSTTFVSEEKLLQQLTSDQRQRFVHDQEQVGRRKKQLQTFPVSKLDENEQTWAELARAFFSFKEFIYVR